MLNLRELNKLEFESNIKHPNIFLLATCKKKQIAKK